VSGDPQPTVEFFTKRNVSVPAKVLQGAEGSDEVRGLALLIVKSKENIPVNLRALSFAANVRVSGGEDIILIGFPRGGGPWAVTKGSISSRQGRDIYFSPSVGEGNSGGPIIQNGKVIGLVAASGQSIGQGISARSIEDYLDGHGITVQETRSSGLAQESQATTPSDVTAEILKMLEAIKQKELEAGKQKELEAGKQKELEARKQIEDDMLMLQDLMSGSVDVDRGNYVLLDERSTHVVGKVKLMEFADFYCEPCYHFETEILPSLEKAYGDSLEVSFVGFPVAPGKLPTAFEMYEQAKMMGKGKEMKRVLFRTIHNDKVTGILDRTLREALIREVGLDPKKFEEGLASAKPAKAFEAGRQLAERMNVRQAPTVIMDGNMKVEPLSVGNFNMIIAHIAKMDIARNL
jgi:thiol:disulfide interchange protein DsbA